MSKLSNIKNPVWMNAEQTLVDVTADVEGVGSALPHTVARNDPDFEHISGGKYGTVKPYSRPKQNTELPLKLKARAVLEGPYGDKRPSVNNYLAQLANLRADGTITPDQEADRKALLAASGWEQTVLDKLEEFLKTPDEQTLASATDSKSWPTFPQEALSVIAKC